MVTLTEFLLARIAEDEALAKAIPSEPYADADVYWEGEFGQGSFNGTDGPYLPAVMRHRPSMVLAECEAKRRLVEVFNYPNDISYYSDEILGILAKPYRDHPDYDPKWDAAGKVL